MQNTNILLCESILDEAKNFKLNCIANHTLPDWFDYEYFKKKLHENGIYGTEAQLTNILGL